MEGSVRCGAVQCSQWRAGCGRSMRERELELSSRLWLGESSSSLVTPQSLICHSPISQRVSDVAALHAARAAKSHWQRLSSVLFVPCLLLMGHALGSDGNRWTLTPSRMHFSRPQTEYDETWRSMLVILEICSVPCQLQTFKVSAMLQIQDRILQSWE